MTTIGNTIIGRTIVNNSPIAAVKIPPVAPDGVYQIRLWGSPWFGRESQDTPIYFEYKKERCAVAQSPMLPMDSTVLTLYAAPGAIIWVCAETDTILNYAVDKIA